MRIQLIPQQGYLAVLAVLIILVIGFLGTTMVGIYVSSANALVYYHGGEEALYIAEAGFEQTARLLLTPIFTGTNGRISCTEITGNTNLTNKAFGKGNFTATSVSGNPIYAYTTASSALTASATTISVTSTSGFAPNGILLIDKEIISYGAISGNSFVGVQRGINHSSPTPHTTATPVSQYQCMANINGGIPSVSTPRFGRVIRQAVGLQEGWAVGDAGSNFFQLTRWNYPNETAWTNSSISNVNDSNLNAISMLSNADGWATGDVNSGSYLFIRWNGSSWTASTLAASCTTSHLNGITSVYAREAYAVGIRYRASGGCSTGGAQRYNILKWNGTTWTQLTPSTSPQVPSDNNNNRNLSAVHVIDTNQSGAGTLGFAVGASGAILEYNGINWVTDTSPVSTNLQGVYVVSASEAWAVGASGRILRWNGSTWSTFTSPTSTQLNSIAMVDTDGDGLADVGWAVGNSGVIVYYNGSSWSTQSSGVANNLLGVAAYPTGLDAWAVGASGRMLHWNGSAWATATSNLSVAINAISIVTSALYPVAWQEIYA